MPFIHGWDLEVTVYVFGQVCMDAVDSRMVSGHQCLFLGDFRMDAVYFWSGPVGSVYNAQISIKTQINTTKH